jgi:uncharacterized FlaG/YvyC family protein
MSEQMIAQVSKIELAAAMTKTVDAQPAQSAPAQAQLVEQSSQVAQKAAPEKVASSNKSKEVSLKFRIDAKTNDVTILVLDRANQKVVRTIPPEELSKLDPGELLEMFV